MAECQVCRALVKRRQPIVDLKTDWRNGLLVVFLVHGVCDSAASWPQKDED